MVKTGVFKKIAALTAAVTVIGSFAAVASAATVATTTTYTDATKAKITVTANVTDVEGAEVTYYATKGSDVVYVDQKTADNGAATFTYVTDATDLKGNVKVGQTGATTADTAVIDGYTVTVSGTVLTVPTDGVNGDYAVTYTPTEGKKVTGLNATGGAKATFVSCAEGKLNFTLTGATGDVEITVVEEDEVAPTPATGSIVDSAAIVAGEGNDTEDAAAKTVAGNRKLTVIGQVSDAVDFGVIVTTDAITAGNNITALPEGAYAATGASAQGYFAVQLIDTNNEATADFIVKGTAYHTAVYFKNVDGTYTVIVGKTVTAN